MQKQYFFELIHIIGIEVLVFSSTCYHKLAPLFEEKKSKNQKIKKLKMETVLKNTKLVSV